MDDYKETVSRYLMQGYCCTEALLRFGMDLLGEDDELLANAATGLCNGMFGGGLCGALTGGCMLLAMADRSSAPALCKELYDWFDLTCKERYGSTDCSDILGDDPWNMLERCRPLVIDVAEKCAALLEDEGLL